VEFWRQVLPYCKENPYSFKIKKFIQKKIPFLTSFRGKNEKSDHCILNFKISKNNCKTFENKTMENSERYRILLGMRNLCREIENFPHLCIV
jgi:hypothetical protein